jgi:hypothetical protein
MLRSSGRATMMKSGAKTKQISISLRTTEVGGGEEEGTRLQEQYL